MPHFHATTMNQKTQGEHMPPISFLLLLGLQLKNINTYEQQEQ